MRVGVVGGAASSACCSCFPPAMGRAAWSRTTSRSRWRPWKALFDTAAGARWSSSASPTSMTQKIDNPDRIPEHAQLPDLPALGRGGKRPERIPARPVAGQHRAALLQLPHHGGTGDDLHRDHGGRCFLLWRRQAVRARWMLWILLLRFPFPYIANTAGWMTAEIGRQPWLVYWPDAHRGWLFEDVSAGNGMFTLLGFMGMYTRAGDPVPVPGAREIEHGPVAGQAHASRAAGDERGRRERIAMETVWFMLVAVMWRPMWCWTDSTSAPGSSTFGGQNADERRMILRAIGPVWDGNEVWLLAAGGTLFFAFPLLYASEFQRLLPAVDDGAVAADAAWDRHRVALAHATIRCGVGFFDVIFSVVQRPAGIFFGAALGNVVRGVPLSADGYFFEPLWTNFRVGTHPGILDWYTVLTGVIALVTLRRTDRCMLRSRPKTT